MTRLMATFEREFLLLAAQMLRCRFEVYHARRCYTPKWVQYTNKPVDQILCYVGYSDHKGEMQLLCQEARVMITAGVVLNGKTSLIS